MSCSQVVDIEELVLGELEAEVAASLRQHVRECAECRHELAMVTAERALFTNRAEVIAEPPAEIALAAHDRIAEEREARRPARAASRALSGVVHLLRRGHVTAACAAALFAVAGLSRLGGGANIVIGPSQVAPITAESYGTNARGLVSRASDESLACSATATKDSAKAPSSSPLPASLRDELGVAAPSPEYSPWAASLASLAQPLACGSSETHDRACERASCDPGVTCSSSRQ